MEKNDQKLSHLIHLTVTSVLTSSVRTLAKFQAMKQFLLKLYNIDAKRFFSNLKIELSDFFINLLIFPTCSYPFA